MCTSTLQKSQNASAWHSAVNWNCCSFFNFRVTNYYFTMDIVQQCKGKALQSFISMCIMISFYFLQNLTWSDQQWLLCIVSTSRQTNEQMNVAHIGILYCAQVLDKKNLYECFIDFLLQWVQMLHPNWMQNTKWQCVHGTPSAKMVQALPYFGCKFWKLLLVQSEQFWTIHHILLKTYYVWKFHCPLNNQFECMRNIAIAIECIQKFHSSEMSNFCLLLLAICNHILIFTIFLALKCNYDDMQHAINSLLRALFGQALHPKINMWEICNNSQHFDYASLHMTWQVAQVSCLNCLL